jgi:hypothetical protein
MAAKSMTSKYNAKKKNAKDRGIPFTLTIKEYKSLLENSDICDYTGIKFDSNVHSKSIERMNDNLGYQADNVIVVSRRVNSLKDGYIDKKNGGHKLTVQDLELIKKTQETLDTKTPEQLTAKYRIGLGEGINMTNNTDKKHSEALTDDKVVNPDIALATSYLTQCERIQGFMVTIDKYKKLINKKTCTVTGRTFDKDYNHTKPQLIKKDQEKEWTNDNTIVVLNIVKNLVISGLSSKEINKIADFV